MTKEQIEQAADDYKPQKLIFHNEDLVYFAIQQVDAALTEAEDIAALEMGKGNHIRATDVVLAIRALKIGGKP